MSVSISSSAVRLRRGVPAVGSACIIATAGVLVAGVATEAGATTFATWGTPTYSGGTGTPSTATGASVTGTLGSEFFVMTAYNGTPVNDGAINAPPFSANLSNSTTYSQPGSTTENAIEFMQGDWNQSISFGSAVADLGIYMVFWRSGTYTMTAFNGSTVVGYSFLSGDYPSAPAVSNNQFTFTTMFTGGIIAFDAAVTDVIFSYVPGPPGNDGKAMMTLGILTSPIPGSGLAAIGTLGVAGIARRRRR